MAAKKTAAPKAKKQSKAKKKKKQSKADENGHMLVGEKDWAFNRIRLPEYVDNCIKGYLPLTRRVKKHTVNEVHHLLNVHSCADDNIPSDIDHEYLYKCFAITDWNINGEGNVIGLPKKWAYELDWDNQLGSSDTDWNDLPCHQVDHDRYWPKCDSWVVEKIFRKLQAKQAKNECKTVDGDDISAMFVRGSEVWGRFLTWRGKGAKAALKYAFEGPATDALDKVWYIPLSMSPIGARPREKPKGKRIKRAGLLEILGAVP